MIRAARATREPPAPTSFLGIPGLWARVARKLLLCVLAGLVLAEAGAGAPLETLRGRVALNAGQVLLVASGEAAVAVFLDSATLLEGVSSTMEIQQGDRVSVEVGLRGQGQVLADRVTVSPRPVTNNRLFLVPADLAREPAEGVRRPAVVDCREEGAYRRGHVPGSIHVGRATGLLAVACDGRDLVLVDADAYGDEAFPLYQKVTRAGCVASVLKGGIAEHARSALPLATGPDGVPAPGERTLRVVDVRSRADYERGHLPGAFSVPFETMTWEAFSNPVGMPPLLFYGTDSGDERATEAARKALGWRYQKHSQVDEPVSYLEGGFAEWVGGGRAVESGPPRGTWSLESTRNADEVFEGEVAALAEAGRDAAVLVDLRGLRQARPPGALHIPLEQLPDRLKELPREKEVIVFCSQGIRSRIAVAILRANGFRARFTREPGTP